MYVCMQVESYQQYVQQYFIDAYVNKSIFLVVQNNVFVIPGIKFLVVQMCV